MILITKEATGEGIINSKNIGKIIVGLSTDPLLKNLTVDIRDKFDETKEVFKKTYTPGETSKLGMYNNDIMYSLSMLFSEDHFIGLSDRAYSIDLIVGLAVECGLRGLNFYELLKNKQSFQNSILVECTDKVQLVSEYLNNSKPFLLGDELLYSSDKSELVLFVNESGLFAKINKTETAEVKVIVNESEIPLFSDSVSFIKNNSIKLCDYSTDYSVDQNIKVSVNIGGNEIIEKGIKLNREIMSENITIEESFNKSTENLHVLVSNLDKDVFRKIPESTVYVKVTNFKNGALLYRGEIHYGENELYAPLGHLPFGTQIVAHVGISNFIAPGINRTKKSLEKVISL